MSELVAITNKMTENTSAALGYHNSTQCASKVIRTPSLKRGKTEEPMSHRVKLERVLGLTVCTNSGLDCDPSSDTIAYPAGCTVVLFNPSKNRQNHLLNTSRKTVTCLRFSPDGRLLATGENGHLPSVRVWDLVDGTQVAEFPGHKYGISCVAFSPSQKYLVSVGCEHDMIVNVWEWKSGVKVASNKVSNKVKAVAFSENGNYFVTAGNRLVKFWYLEYSRSAKYKEPVPLMGRSAILGEQRNNDFCDVACGKGEMSDSTYAITRSGLLCEFNNRRLLDKWVELRTSCANCMTVTKTFIFIGCAEGIVRCFSPQTLQYITTLPRTHYLGVDIAQGTNISHTTTHPNNAKYPDTIAVSFDENNMKLTCVYNDHSLYIWDVKDIKRVGKTHSFLYHSACIWGVEMYPDCVKNSAMPLGSFLTCSSDDTIRVWNLDSPDPQANTKYRTNIYSNELLKVMYVDPEMNFLKDMDITKGEKGDSTSYDGRNGVRSIRISPDGKHLASGDREGNIRITDLHTLEEIVRIEAHDGEVLCVEYSNSDDPRKKYLASASRDRLIHVFSVDEGYKLVQTLDDHSSSITAVRFLNNNNQLQMVSCGADKSIIFRTLQRNIPGSDVQHTFVREQITAAKTTLYDMEGDCTQKHVLTACQDRNIRVYSVNTSKHTKTFKGSVGEDGSLIKISMDPSGILVATSSTDKTLSIYDYYNTECVATMLGHSELATGLRFTRDCRRLISASGDGCIFVWKMPHDLMVTMRARLAQQVARAGKKLAQLGITIGDNEENENLTENKINSTHQVSNDTDYRLNMGQLPQWAQKSILDTNIPIIEKSSRSVEAPKGRWAQRAHLEPNYDVPILDRNYYTQGSMSKERRLDSDGSKEDSSIDSGTELRSFKHEKRKQFVTQVTDIKESIMKTEHIEMSHQRNRHHTDDSSIGSFKYEDLESTEHDGDVEDISEGESVEETRHQLIYYPPAEDTNSDYTVNAMDVEELRKSQRRAKRPDLLLAHGEASQSVSGSQESDDDEQASTPSGEHSDRKISGSTESLNIMSRREKVLKNTFESLSGAEMEKEPSPKNKTSLSAKYMSASGVRNSNVIQAARVTKHEAQSTSKREELQRRIEETRRQLQCVGYRSNLESSQSIQDLSPRGMSYHDSRKMSSLKPSLQVPNIGKQKEFNTLPHSYKKSSTNKTNPNFNKRPFSLNLSTDFSVGNMFRKANANRTTNLSLPESPVFEDLSPPFCSSEFVKSSDIRAKRHSCGFFIDIKSDYNFESKEDCKSLESLSEVGQSAVLSVDEQKSDLSDFSSDSLESCAEFPSNKPPRRCVSEYQIFSRGIIQQGEKTKFHSEENILVDEGEMMDNNIDELDGRHSSASFFLRCKEACRSTESILTDESEYQYLFTNREKEEFHSTESILTDISDSVSKDFPKDVEKQPVLRTRSLQDSSEFKGGENFGEQTDLFYSNTNASCTKDGRPKTEFFFIPLGGECVKALPSIIAKRFQTKESESSSCQPDTYPIVAHKPPKPHQKSNKSQRKSWQKVPVNTVGKQIEAVKARAAIWKKDEDMKRVWQSENCSKDPGLNSMREDFHNNFSNGKPVKSMSLQHIHHKQNDDLVCRELKPLEFIVKEVIIDDISCAKICDLNNSSNLSNDKNDSSSMCQKVIMSSVDNKTLEEMQKISEVKRNCIYEGKNVNPINLTKTQSDGGKLRPRMPSVKLLSQNFERISIRNVQDEGVISGEDNSIAPMGYDSGSSTPATSSSCTNSPKRLTNQLAKRLKNNNILPSKCNAVIDADISGGIRRACSLSDLSNTPSKLRSVQPSQSVATGKSINVRNTRNSTRHGGTKASSTITRSTSVGTLNQSDSESEQSHSQSVRRVMRPTISSLNKAISGQKSSTVNRRRGMTSSYSTMTLNKPDNEDSSSEEGKNNCLPQQRSSSTDRSGSTAMNRRVAPAPGLGRSGSERDLAHSQRLASRAFNKPVRSASGMVRSTSNLEDASSKAAYNVDFENTPVPQLLDNMKELLDSQQSMILEFMNQMQRRLADETVDMSERSVWKNSFQEAIQEYIKSLSKAAMTNKIQEALDSLPSDSASNSEVVSMVQQCSDILISMVQKKMSEPKN